MKIVFAVFGFHILCSVGFTAPSSSTEFSDLFTEDDLSTSESNEGNLHFNQTNVDLTENKINDSEIYENGQTAKEDRQRSFVFIQNKKSRTPWKIKTRGSFFLDVLDNPKEVFNDVDGHLSPFRVPPPAHHSYSEDNVKPRLPPQQNKSYSNTPSQNYFNSMNYHFTANLDGRNKKNNLKRPKYVPNINTGPISAPTPATMKSYYYRKGFKHQLKNTVQNNMYNSVDDPKINTTFNIQYQVGRNYKLPNMVPAQASMIPPQLAFDNSPEANNQFLTHISGHDEFEKLNKFINDIANGDTADQFNCYNRDCAPRSKQYRVNLNNGVMRGASCVCQNPRTPNAAQKWRARQKMAPVSEKASTRSVNVESDDSYEALVKETKKLTKIVDGME